MGLLIANLYSHLITGCVWRSLRFLAFLYRARQFRLSRGCWSPPATITICPLTLYSHYWAFALEFGCGSTLVIVVCVCVRVHNLHACMLRRRTLHACTRTHAYMHACSSCAHIRILRRGPEPHCGQGRLSPPASRSTLRVAAFGRPAGYSQLPKGRQQKNIFCFFVEFGINGKSKTSWTWHQNRSVWDEAASPGSLISMGT